MKQINHLIRKHNRLLFGAFTVAIIVSFMGFLTPGQFGCDGLGGIGGYTVGTAFGERVSTNDLQELIQGSRILAQMGMGAQREINYEQAFYQYGMLEAARRQGLAVSDQEVADFFRQLPVFHKDGVFSSEVYKEFIRKMFRQDNDEPLVDAFRNVLLVSKLQQQLGGEVIVTDHEIEMMFRQYNAKYAVKAAQFPAASFLKSVKDDSQGVKAYFDANRRNYQLPGKVAGLVVEFPIARFAPAAEAKATAEELKKFHEKSPQLFTKDDKLLSFEEAAKEVRAEFVKATSKDIAMRAAYEFAGGAYEAAGSAGEKRADVFRALAAANKLTVVEAGLTDFDAPAIGPVKSPDFLRNLAMAYNAHWITNPHQVDESIFIGLATEQVPPRQAELNDVAAKLMVDYRNAEAMRLASEAAEKALDTLAAAPDAAARAKAFDALVGGTVKEFNFVLGLEMPPAEFFPAAIAALQLMPGENSQMIPADEGPQLVLLLQRTPGSMDEFAQKKEMLRMNLSMMKRQMLQQAFQEELMAQCQINESLAGR